MCYDIASGLKGRIKYAKYRGERDEDIKQLEMELKQMGTGFPELHYISGFAHPALLVFTNMKPLKPRLFRWGLIPSWVKRLDQAIQISRQTLNARVESIYEKPSFKQAAINQRCLVYIDAYYEYHHANKKTYPFRISRKDDEPLVLAGLWNEWLDEESGELIPTVSIVTTKANALKSMIHNNPKNEEARMPIILSKENQHIWLTANEQQTKQLAIPFPNEELAYHTVKPLKGKHTLGNVKEVAQEFIYEDLKILKYAEK